MTTSTTKRTRRTPDSYTTTTASERGLEADPCCEVQATSRDAGAHRSTQETEETQGTHETHETEEHTGDTRDTRDTRDRGDTGDTQETEEEWRDEREVFLGFEAVPWLPYASDDIYVLCDGNVINDIDNDDTDDRKVLMTDD